MQTAALLLQQREGCERACPPSLALFLSSSLRRRNDNILRLSNGGTIFALDSDPAAAAQSENGCQSVTWLCFRQFVPRFSISHLCENITFLLTPAFQSEMLPSLLSQANHAIMLSLPTELPCQSRGRCPRMRQEEGSHGWHGRDIANFQKEGW